MMLRSALVYNGPSMFDGRPIIAVVTGLDGRSKNPKTGPMAHLWILVRSSSPIRAVERGADASICGTCPFRGAGCYVPLRNAPHAIYRAYQRRRYRAFLPADINRILKDKGLSIRLGAYGDPAALPFWILDDLTRDVPRTGYTHAWRQVDVATYGRLLMASTQSVQGYRDAIAQGWRSFRTRTQDQPLESGEIVCPASVEAGHWSTCEDCNLCNGTVDHDRRKSIAILAHGYQAPRAMAFIRSQAELESRIV